MPRRARMLHTHTRAYACMLCEACMCERAARTRVSCMRVGCIAGRRRQQCQMLRELCVCTCGSVYICVCVCVCVCASSSEGACARERICTCADDWVVVVSFLSLGGWLCSHIAPNTSHTQHFPHMFVTYMYAYILYST